MINLSCSNMSQAESPYLRTTRKEATSLITHAIGPFAKRTVAKSVGTTFPMQSITR